MPQEAATAAIGDSPAFRRILGLIDRVAHNAHALLISGPTGAGKEVVAQLLHQRGPGASESFIDLNCSALPEHLVEAELFGYAKGAFTGATADKPGHFDMAGKGTLFFDEIGELPLSLQPKLLRVLETRTYRPLGSSELRRFHGRVLAATHRDLPMLVREGKFREDLYHRLTVFQLELPGLDQRRDDIPALLRHFASLQARPLYFSAEASEQLRKLPWPGHIRQLRNLVERIAILTDNEVITPDVLAPFVTTDTVPGQANALLADALLALDGPNKLDAAIDLMLDRALERSRGSKSGAAALLGVHRKVVERRLQLRDHERQAAPDCLEQARKLIESSCFQEAAPLLQRGLGLTNAADPPALHFELHHTLAICYRSLHGWLSAEAQAEYEAALHFGEGCANPSTLDAILFGIWTTQLMKMQLTQARATAQRMLSRAQSTQSPDTLAEAHVAMANTLFWLGDAQEVIACLERGGMLMESAPQRTSAQGFDLTCLALMLEGLAAFQLGRFQHAREAQQRLEEQATDEQAHSFNRAIALQGAAWLACLFDDMSRLGPLADELDNIARIHSFHFYRGIGLIFQGCRLAAMGDFRTAEARMREGYEEHVLRHGGNLFYSFQAWKRGEALLAAGCCADAEILLATAIDEALERQDRAYLAELQCARGLARQARGEAVGAEEDLRAALSTALTLNSVPARVCAATRLAELLRSDGRNEQAGAVLAKALRGLDPQVPYPALQRALHLRDAMAAGRLPTVVHYGETDDGVST